MSKKKNVSQSHIEKIINKYFESMQKIQGETVRSERFLLLLNDLFGIQPGFIEDYIEGIEKYIEVQQRDRILRGEVDNLYGSLVIEFKKDLNKRILEAKEQLRKYIAVLWSQESPGSRRPYIGIVADGIDFAVYSASTSKTMSKDLLPAEITLNLVEKVNLTNFEPYDVYFWLDRYFLRKESLSPTTENIVKDFSVGSHAFQIAFSELLNLWEQVKEASEFNVVYKNWEKYLRIVYGTSVAESELFCRHTYLAILAKLMAWCRLGNGIVSSNEIFAVLEGKYFRDQRIENFLEEDFFSWVIRKNAKKRGIKIAHKLLSILRYYNLKDLTEDVLKSLYQGLVDPKTRHDLGEFYTPDWLAHRMIKALISQNKRSSFLDPACGSGTFLYFAIKEKRNSLPHTSETLDHILDSVYGVDIHPLAVIIAKTNYILALGNLIQERRGKISIPVYLSDTIRLPEREVKPTLWIQIPSFKMMLDEIETFIPEKMLEEPVLYDEAIDATREFAKQNVGKKINETYFSNYIKAQYPNLFSNKDFVKALFHTAGIMKKLIEEERDTIWAFILKNIYKPIFLKNKFDFVIGNPPWLVLRNADIAYQDFLKEQITKEYNLLSGRGELITHLELGTLFLLRCSHLYLKESGKIAFVLPKSIFAAGQHDGLRQDKFLKVRLQINEIWDLEETAPIFSVPACVLFATKNRELKITYPIKGEILQGKLDRRNAALTETSQLLSVHKTAFHLHIRGKRSYWSTEQGKRIIKKSYYNKYFFQGSSIVPRVFWFVEIKSAPLGFDPVCPLLQTSTKARKTAKKPYNHIIMEGNVESKFLYGILLSGDIVPFGYIRVRLGVLPIKPLTDGYRILTSEEASKKGYVHLANWLAKAEKEWQEKRGTKAGKMSIYERLDRYRGLTKQSPQTKYRVIYPDGCRIMLATVFTSIETYKLVVENQNIGLQNIVFDCTNYIYETQNHDEAYYLCAVLNSSYIDKLLGSLRKRKQKTHPHVAKKIFDVAQIPQFSPSNKMHVTLTKLGETSSNKVSGWIENNKDMLEKSVTTLRANVRKILSEELNAIDSIVKRLLKY